MASVYRPTYAAANAEGAIGQMNIVLTSKTALVTGSTAGIGRAIATGLAAAGAHVIVHGRGQATVDSTVQKLKQSVPSARFEGVTALSSGPGEWTRTVRSRPISEET